ncbi:MAG TPA: glycosyltransferase [Oligoflexia bacterium]|nr:glycosyltransferase [Oligoflexia bacterium]HMP48562.1 glycosyltransferase [Oligoflexia bacterium]
MKVGSKCNILFLIPSLSGGGAERVICTLATHLDRSKFNVAIAVVTLKNAVYKDDLPDDVEVIDIKASRVLFALPRIITLLWKRKPHIAFSTLGHLNLALSIVRPILPSKTKYIARESSIVSEVQKNIKYSTLWKLAYQFFYIRFDKIIAQSNYMRDDLITHFKIPADKITVIHNPLDIDKINILANEPLEDNVALTSKNQINLIAAGRLSRVKGFDLLLKAISMVNDINVRLLILGEGELNEDLKVLSYKLNISKKVFFLGFKKNPYPYLKNADALILSSHYEGFPNVVLEALACGTPVIATPAPGGTKEILHGLKECLIVEEISPKAISDGISRFDFNVSLDTEIASAYSLETIMRRYEREILIDVLI